MSSQFHLDEDKRSVYLAIFCSLLIFSIITTLVIYYCVRHKKKYYFDAAGRKFIISSGDFENIVNKIRDIIQFDRKDDLEQQVIRKFIN